MPGGCARGVRSPRTSARLPPDRDKESSPLVDLSIVVCTRERSDLLRGAVDSLIGQTADPSGFEVIVVDNSPGGSVAEWMEAQPRPRRPVIRHVRQPSPGLSRSRNAGLDAAAGRVVSFLDDDARAERRWVEMLLQGLVESGGAVGGAIHLQLDSTPPRWLGSELRRYLGETPFGGKARPLQWPEYPYGSNFAIDRAAMLRLGGFREDLGRGRGTLLSGEEREFFFRYYRDGGHVRYQPQAIVHHLVPAERLRKAFFRRRLFWEGRSQRRAEVLTPDMERRTVTRAADGMLRRTARAVLAALGRDEGRAFLHECEARRELGYLWEAAVG